MSDLPTRAIWLKSAYAEPPEALGPAISSGLVTVLDQRDFTEATLFGHCGLLTGMQLDQDQFLGFSASLKRWLEHGGRWFFNGHMIRPILPQMAPFRPMVKPSRRDFVQTRARNHPILDGIAASELEANKGVAGFYGRGCNPMPSGAHAVTTLGPNEVPVDWLWPWQKGGAIFSHAGNDLWSIGSQHGCGQTLVTRIVQWATRGLPCA